MYGVFTSGIANISNNANISGVDNALFLVGNALATVTGGNLQASKYDGIYTGGNSSLKVEGGIIQGKNSGIYHESTNTIQINNGTLIGTTQNGITVVKGGTGNVEINGGEISGKYTGIQRVTSGKLSINGGIIKAISEWDGVKVLNEDTGDIIITGGTIEGHNNAIYTQGCGTINISGGNLKGNNYEGIAIGKQGKVKLNVTGGIITGPQGIWVDPKGEINLTMMDSIIIGTKKYGIVTSGASNCEITISGGKIEGKNDAIGLLNGGSNIIVNILSGDLIANTYDGIGVYANATVNVGDGNQSINNNNLNVYGKNFGVYVSADYNTTVNYNNGTLRGQVASYTGKVNIRSGYTANTILTNGIYVTTLK